MRKIQKILLLTLVFYIAVECVFSKSIPSFVHLCRRHSPDFSKCFNNTLYEILPYMEKGIPEMNIVAIEPLRVNSLNVNTGEGTSVRLAIHISNGTIYGFKDLKITALEGNVDAVRFSASITVPSFWLQGDYKTDGRILLLDINSMGRVYVNATDVDMEVEWYGEHYTYKKQQHLRFTKIEYKKLKFHNIVLSLEDSNKERQPFIDTINKAINDNIDTLWSELEVLIKDTLGEISLETFNRVYRTFANNELFPVD